MDIKELIIELCSMAGPSGYEDKVGVRVKEILSGLTDTVHTDVMGNVLAVKKCGREGVPKLMLDAHMDEIGFVITGMEEGYLKFDKVGGVDARMLPACEIEVLTEPPVRGVVRTMPPHVLTSEDMEKAVKIEDLFIDVGMTQEEAEKRIPIGTPAVYAETVRPLGKNGLLCGKALDDRACLAAVIKAAELLKDEKLNVDLYIMASTQEEVGLRGAKVGAFGLFPDYCISVDVCHASTPDCEEYSTHKIGGGPAVTKGPNMNRAFTEKIIDAAEKCGIDYQTDIEPGGSSGTNAAVIQVTREGVATALMGIPLKYMHTPVEVISAQDAEKTAELIAAAVKSM